MELNEIISKKIEYKPVAGVYFLLKDDEVVYVGQSSDVHYRMNAHATDKNFDSYYVIEEYDKKKRISLEGQYILKFNPPLNKVGSNVRGYMRLESMVKAYGGDSEGIKDYAKKNNIHPVKDNVYKRDDFQNYFKVDFEKADRRRKNKMLKRIDRECFDEVKALLNGKGETKDTFRTILLALFHIRGGAELNAALKFAYKRYKTPDSEKKKIEQYVLDSESYKEKIA